MAKAGKTRFHPDRSASTLDAARVLAAEVAAAHPKRTAHNWQHVGGEAPGRKKILPTNRLLVLDPDDDAPRWAWTRLEVVRAK